MSFVDHDRYCLTVVESNVPFDSGLDLFNTQLRDYSIQFENYEKEKIKRDLAYLNSFENQSMSSVERQSFDVMKYFLNVNLRCDLSDEFSFHKYLINQMMGAQSEVISFLTKFHRIRNFNEANAYLIRVKIPKLKSKSLFEFFCFSFRYNE